MTKISFVPKMIVPKNLLYKTLRNFLAKFSFHLSLVETTTVLFSLATQTLFLDLRAIFSLKEFLLKATTLFIL